MIGLVVLLVGIPVSYTHLDVYKRQALEYAAPHYKLKGTFYTVYKYTRGTFITEYEVTDVYKRQIYGYHFHP